MSKIAERIAAFVFGAVFVTVLLVLAVRFPNPTPFQYTTFRIVLALAAGGVAAMIPGFLAVNVSTWLRASGALAVFAIVYFYSPAELTGVSVKTEPRLRITRIELLDESSYLQDPQGGQLTALARRPSAEFRYSRLADLRIAFLFVSEGHAVAAGLVTDLHGATAIRTSAGEVWPGGPLLPLCNVRDWRQRPHVKRIGHEAVTRFLSMAPSLYDVETTPIPLIVVLDRFEGDMSSEDVEVVITLTDNMAKTNATRSFWVKVRLGD